MPKSSLHKKFLGIRTKAAFFTTYTNTTLSNYLPNTFTIFWCKRLCIIGR